MESKEVPAAQSLTISRRFGLDFWKILLLSPMRGWGRASHVGELPVQSATGQFERSPGRASSSTSEKKSLSWNFLAHRHLRAFHPLFSAPGRAGSDGPQSLASISASMLPRALLVMLPLPNIICRQAHVHIKSKLQHYYHLHLHVRIVHARAPNLAFHASRRPAVSTLTAAMSG